jgi:hypothetical protein
VAKSHHPRQILYLSPVFLLSLLAIVVISLAKFWQIFGKLVGAVPAQRTVSDKTNLKASMVYFVRNSATSAADGFIVYDRRR